MKYLIADLLAFTGTRLCRLAIQMIGHGCIKLEIRERPRLYVRPKSTGIRINFKKIGLVIVIVLFLAGMYDISRSMRGLIKELRWEHNDQNQHD